MNVAFVLAAGIGVYGSFFAPPVPRNAIGGHSVVQTAPLAPAPQPKPESKTAVVCGMTLVPAHPTDSAMKHGTPTNRTFPMVKVEPQICKR
jgi:H+/Cl- antiporter ClcA